MKNVSDMTTAELVAEYNGLTGKSVKKFSSRAAGEKQVAAARGAARTAEPKKEEPKKEEPKKEEPKKERTKPVWPFGGNPAVTTITNAKPKKEESKKAAPKKAEPKKEEPKKEEPKKAAPKKAEPKKEEPKKEEPKKEEPKKAAPKKAAPKKAEPTGNRSDAIRESWNNKNVAEKRAQRNGVQVAGAQYRSVKEAFLDLKLPLGKHIAFRMSLKESGKSTFEHDGKKYNFVLTD